MTKEIFLGGKIAAGRVALVDDEDYELVKDYRWWCAGLYGYTRTSYARTHIYRDDRWTTTSMHGLIFDALGINHPWGIDHVDHDGLNNQRSNLRAVTNQQNQANSRSWVGGRSPYKGVEWREPYRKWRAYIGKNGRRYHLGHYDTEIEAARAYNEKAVELFGEYACLNEIGDVRD